MVKDLIYVIIYMYYCMTGRAIQGNIMFEIDGISLTERRDDSGVENRIFPSIYCTTQGIAIIVLLYVTGFGKRDLIAHLKKIELLLP